MVELAHDFDEFFGSLTAHGVEFLVIGACALAFHGVPRFTRPTVGAGRTRSFFRTATGPEGATADRLHKATISVMLCT
jgi:hypothetical protein